MGEDKKQLMCQCFHCGNQGLLNIVGENAYEFGGGPEDEVQGAFEWKMLRCPVCNKVTLHQEYGDSEMMDETGWYKEDKILYPENRILEVSIPHTIKSAFESAIKVKNIDTALCVLALRRVLEQICLERKATGKTLEAMIKDLINKNILPKGFDEACYIIRILGNSAAHGADSVFYMHEVEELISLLKSIIEYLYVIPNKIAGLQRRIKVKAEEASNS